MRNEGENLSRLPHEIFLIFIPPRHVSSQWADIIISLYLANVCRPKVC